MTDPDTPFLHVGMNAPRSEREGGWIQRSWGVGVQNMAREYLPRSVARQVSGDGLLRMQVQSKLSQKGPEDIVPGRWLSAIRAFHSRGSV